MMQQVRPAALTLRAAIAPTTLACVDGRNTTYPKDTTNLAQHYGPRLKREAEGPRYYDLLRPGQRCSQDLALGHRCFATAVAAEHGTHGFTGRVLCKFHSGPRRSVDR